MTNGVWTKIGITAAITVPLFTYVGTAAVMHYRIERLETDRRDYQALVASDQRLAAEILEQTNRLDNKIDATGDRIRTQWPIIADLKDRVVRLEEWRSLQQ